MVLSFLEKYRSITSNPNASLEAKWLVNDPCGTRAAWTMSRTEALAKPCAWTTRRPSVKIVSLWEGFAISIYVRRVSVVSIWTSVLEFQGDIDMLRSAIRSDLCLIRDMRIG